jgi:hypothetical protein
MFHNKRGNGLVVRRKKVKGVPVREDKNKLLRPVKSRLTAQRH